MKKMIFAATMAAATVAATATLTACSSEPATASNVKEGFELNASTEDLFKPGSEMMFTTNCQENSAKLTTTFGAETTMTPAADSAGLVGYITAPVNIEAGPDDGYHTYTVTCGSDSATFRFSNDTNGAK